LIEATSFNGEHLLPGNLGHALVVLSFVTALLSAFSFWHANNTGDKTSQRIAKIGFGIHGIAVLGIIASLFFIIYNHYFEYFYAWQHSSLALPTHYMISCFWEGQEGSFLLWLFWQLVLAIFIMIRPSIWRNPVMTVIMLSQAVLSSMLLGIDITDIYKFGSSPFILLREARPELLELPVMAIRNISKADYLQIITDGTGLNPLLQNYWMVIHPPTLFFGFATTIVPFAFAIAGLWNRKYKEWMKPALPWALLAVMVLGTGIIMGGIWAYESLSFGGYWAWDPVENASLIPWIIMIAAVHVMMINRTTGQALIISYILALLSFILVLYATFLTRSGILGDTSVHSFTDLGLSRQLLVFLFMFLFLPVVASFKRNRDRWICAIGFIVLLIVNIVAGHFLAGLNILVLLAGLVVLFLNFNSNLPLSTKEESIYSREFWMFIGSLVLLLSAGQVLSSTSIPVMNKITSSFSGIFNWLYENLGHLKVFENMAQGNIAPPIDAIAHYNRWQLPMAIIIALLTGLIQFFRYKKTPKGLIMNKLLLVSVSSLLLTVLLSLLFKLNIRSEFMLVVLLFSATFAIVGNAIFIFSALKFKWKLAGGSMAHIGFGMMLIGILVSSSRKHVISLNDRMSYGDNFTAKDTRENILLLKGEPVQMGDYMVTYLGDSTEGPNTFYEVHYENKLNNESFSLFPNAQYNPDQGLMPNPDTRHYLLKDIYTHVSSVPEYTEDEDKWEEEKVTQMEFGDSIFINNAIVIFSGVQKIRGDSISSDLSGHLMQIAELKIIKGDSSWTARPVYGVKDGLHDYNIFSFAEKASIRFNYYPENIEGRIIHNVETSIKPPRYIIMKAIVFPYINLLWTGTIVMVVGFAFAIARRKKENSRSET
jgi:cytochrome c-type biogenesis protein CcmF